MKDSAAELSQRRGRRRTSSRTTLDTREVVNDHNALNRTTKTTSTGVPILNFLCLLLFASVGVYYRYIKQNINNDTKEEVAIDFANSRMIFTEEMLSEFNGVNRRDKLLFLSIVGEVFDVTRGRKFYGIGEHYHFFTAKDATMGFITGTYDDTKANGGLQAFDVDSMSDKEVLSIERWLEFYRQSEEYRKVGVLANDVFYEWNSGEPTAKIVEFNRRAHLARVEKEKNDNDRDENIKCRSELTDERWMVWCEKQEEQDAYPRIVAKDGICACFVDNGYSNSRELYPNCSSRATRCFV